MLLSNFNCLAVCVGFLVGLCGISPTSAVVTNNYAGRPPMPPAVGSPESSSGSSRSLTTIPEEEAPEKVKVKGSESGVKVPTHITLGGTEYPLRHRIGGENALPKITYRKSLQHIAFGAVENRILRGLLANRQILMFVRQASPILWVMTMLNHLMAVVNDAVGSRDTTMTRSLINMAILPLTILIALKAQYYWIDFWQSIESTRSAIDQFHDEYANPKGDLEENLKYLGPKYISKTLGSRFARSLKMRNMRQETWSDQTFDSTTLDSVRGKLNQNGLWYPSNADAKSVAAYYALWIAQLVIANLCSIIASIVVDASKTKIPLSLILTLNLIMPAMLTTLSLRRNLDSKIRAMKRA